MLDQIEPSLHHYIALARHFVLLHPAFNVTNEPPSNSRFNATFDEKSYVLVVIHLLKV